MCTVALRNSVSLSVWMSSIAGSICGPTEDQGGEGVATVPEDGSNGLFLSPVNRARMPETLLTFHSITLTRHRPITRTWPELTISATPYHHRETRYANYGSTHPLIPGWPRRMSHQTKGVLTLEKVVVPIPTCLLNKYTNLPLRRNSIPTVGWLSLSDLAYTKQRRKVILFDNLKDW